MSRWRLPMDFHPVSGARMSNTSPEEWTTDGTNAFLQVVGQRQEFVVHVNAGIEEWVRQIIRDGSSSIRN